MRNYMGNIQKLKFCLCHRSIWCYSANRRKGRVRLQYDSLFYEIYTEISELNMFSKVMQYYKCVTSFYNNAIKVFTVLKL
jgi:hypothetical protein